MFQERFKSQRMAGRTSYVEAVPGERGVVVEPPDEDGGRQVRIGGLVVGDAYGLWDMVVFLHRAGLPWDEDEISRAELIEWHGGGPHDWGS